MTATAATTRLREALTAAVDNLHIAIVSASMLADREEGHTPEDCGADHSGLADDLVTIAEEVAALRDKETAP